jgi:hypothetical protein
MAGEILPSESISGSLARRSPRETEGSRPALHVASLHCGRTGEALLLTAIYLVMPAGRLSFRHAVIGGVTAAVLWEITRHILVWYYTTMSQIDVADTGRLWLSNHVYRGPFERRDRRLGVAPGSASDRGVRAYRPRADRGARSANANRRSPVRGGRIIPGSIALARPSESCLYRKFGSA